MSSMGQRIRKERLKMGIKPQDFSDKVGIDRTTLVKLEKDRQQYSSAPSAVRIARFLGVHTDWLITGKGKKYR